MRRPVRTVGGSDIYVGCGGAQPYFATGIGGGGRACACGPCGKGEREGIRGMGAVENGRFAKMGTQPKDLVATRWVLTWKKVDGAKTVKA